MKKEKGHWILGNPDSTVRVKILRWIARIWSLLALILALVIAISPDPYAVNPITARELFMLSLWLIAILGLVLGWRFERMGALITIIIIPVREALYVLFYREWTVNFLLIWALVIPPAILYLLAWSGDRKK
ncbi:MAG: hypothetical protein SCH68_10470 [Brevefilum sp.]|nr:hypothetical protein [Brevefilum sp.]